MTADPCEKLRKYLTPTMLRELGDDVEDRVVGHFSGEWAPRYRMKNGQWTGGEIAKPLRIHDPEGVGSAT